MKSELWTCFVIVTCKVLWFFPFPLNFVHCFFALLLHCCSFALPFLRHYYCFVDVFSTSSTMLDLVPIGFVVVVPLCYCSIVVLLVLFMFGWYCPPFAHVGNYGVWSSTNNPQQLLATNIMWVFFCFSCFSPIWLVFLFFILLLPFFWEILM